jgi:PAS domain S-box-containing protein
MLSVAAAIAIVIELIDFAAGDTSAAPAIIVLACSAAVLGVAAVIRRRGQRRAAAMLTAGLLLVVVAVSGYALGGAGPIGLVAPIAFVLVVPYLRGWRLQAVALVAVAVTVYAVDQFGIDAGVTDVTGRLGTAVGTIMAMALLLLLTWRAIRLGEREQARRERLVADLPVGVVRISPRDRLVEANQAFAGLLGYDEPEQLEQMPLSAILADANVDPWEAVEPDESGLREGVAALRRRDGSDVWVRFRTRPVVDDRGRTIAYESAVEDVTPERSEREARNRLGDLLESLPDAVFSLAFDGTFLSWNRGAELLYGRPSAEILGTDLFAIVRPSYVPRVKAVLDVVAKGRSVPPFDLEQSRPDGTPIVVSLAVAPIRDADGAVVAASVIGRDITEQTRLIAQQEELEAQLLQAQKMEAVGRLAGGIAHDFNNLLTAITGFGGLVAADLRGNQLDDQLQVLRAAERAADLTRRLLAFARRSAADPRPVALDGVLEDAFQMVRRLVPERIEVELKAASGRWVVVDPVEVEQVLLNLVVNAVDATPDAGYIRVATEAVDLDEEFAEQHLGSVEGPHVRLTVADTGVGMDETVRARIFEPFFTTKERGEGTGLGMATVYAIVRRSGGTVWVDSAPGVGTTFSIYLPAVPAVVEPRDVAVSEVPRGTESVLLLEDEEAVRALAARILEQAGYVVHRAPNPADAAARLAEVRVDAIVTDVIMPGQSGPDFVAGLDEGLPVVFMSGYTGAGTARMRLELPTRALVAKPFDPSALAGAVRRVLDAADAGATVRGAPPGADAEPGQSAIAAATSDQEAAGDAAPGPLGRPA